VAVELALHLLLPRQIQLSLLPRQNRAFPLLRLRRPHLQLLLPLRLAVPVPAQAILVRVILPRDQKLVPLLTTMRRLFLSIRLLPLKV
jgi:hypothetical protein